MIPRQLPLPLPARPALGRADYFVSHSNAVAVAQIDDWWHWPQRRCVLIGPQGSGKTHLARVWAHATDARMVDAGALDAADIPALAAGPACLDDAQRVAGDPAREAALFHLLNLSAAEGGAVLLTAPAPPRDWGLGLADLASRLEAAQAARLGPPDDGLLSALLVKLFADRQLSPAPEVIPFLVARIPRSHLAAADIVARLDAAALARQSGVTRPLAAAVLDASPTDAGTDAS